MKDFIQESDKRFDERFPGVLETTFKVESSEYPIPPVTRFVEGELKSFLRTELTRFAQELEKVDNI